MGVNDDRLSAGEQNELRALVTAGAGRMRAARRRRMQAITGGAAVVLVAAVVGAVALTALGSPDRVANPIETSTTPAPTPTATPTPTPEPTATQQEETPAAVRGIEPFGGDCNNALTTEEVGDFLGIEAPPITPAWSDGAIALQGGLLCMWGNFDVAKSVSLWAYPSSVVAPYSISPLPSADCEPELLCARTAERNGVWVQMGTSLPGADVNGLVDVVLGRAAQWPAPEPAERTSEWWDPVACDDIAAAVDVAEALGVETAVRKIPDGVPTDTIGPDGVPQRRGGIVNCAFSLDGEAYSMTGDREVLVRTVPGGGAYASDIAATDGAVSIAVRGGYAGWSLPNDVTWEGSNRYVVVSDGVNLVRVGTSDVDSTPGDDALGELGVRVIEALNGTVG